MQTTLTAQQEFIEATIRFVKELEADGWYGAGLEAMLDEQIEDVIFSVLYKNASSTRRINKLKKVNNSLGS
jgi:hypothetical protein